MAMPIAAPAATGVATPAWEGEGGGGASAASDTVLFELIGGVCDRPVDRVDKEGRGEPGGGGRVSVARTPW